MDRQRFDLETLQKQAKTLQEQISVLQDCLVASGVLRMETFLARMHRQQFSSMCVRHPLLGEPHNFETALAATWDAASVGPPCGHAWARHRRLCLQGHQ